MASGLVPKMIRFFFIKYYLLLKIFQATEQQKYSFSCFVANSFTRLLLTHLLSYCYHFVRHLLTTSYDKKLLMIAKV